MGIWTRIVGVVLLIYAGYVLYSGRLVSGDDYGHTSRIERSKKPVQFWLSVGLMLVLAVVLIFNVFNF